MCIKIESSQALDHSFLLQSPWANSDAYSYGLSYVVAHVHKRVVCGVSDMICYTLLRSTSA